VKAFKCRRKLQGGLCSQSPTGWQGGPMGTRVGRRAAICDNIEAMIDDATLLRMGGEDKVHHGACRAES